MLSLGLPRTNSLNAVEGSNGRHSNRKKPVGQAYGAPISLDRYLTNEGHRLVVSYLRHTQTQNTILQGSLHKLEEKDVDDLIKSYGGTPTHIFKTLDFKHLSLSSFEIKLLCRLLKAKVSNIQILKMTHNRLAGSLVKTLFEALKSNSTVRTLDLSFNSLGDREAKWLAKLLKKNATLREVYLASNQISVDGAKVLAKALRENKSVVRISLEQNRLSAQGGIAIADMLKFNRSIRYMHLGGNNLSAQGAQAISEMLKVNETLVSLSLDVNNIGVDGARAVAEALKVNKTLTHLYMPRNNIEDEGVHFLCRGLVKNTKLIYIDLEFNGIGAHSNTDGVKALAKLFESSSVPRAINLNYNPIGDQGCEYLSNGFYKNQTLESIILSNCDIGLEGATAISESLKVNRGLQNISLHNNAAIGADGHTVLADALETNTSLKGVQLDYNFDEWSHVSDSIQVSLTRNHFLQQEKYATACRILKAARVMLNAKLDSSSIVSPAEFLQIPYEIQELILFSLDAKKVLTDGQHVQIVKYAMRKETLGTPMESFLSQIFGVYYPLTSDVRLWPTEAGEREVYDRY